jgi:hypothetical protein
MLDLVTFFADVALPPEDDDVGESPAPSTIPRAGPPPDRRAPRAPPGANTPRRRRPQ